MAIPSAELAARTESDAGMDEASKTLDRWHETIREFTGGVTFDQEDVESFIEHYPSLTELDEDEKLEEKFEDE